MIIWSAVLTVVGVLGLYLAGRKNRLGWLLNLGAQVLWMIYAVQTGQWPFVVSSLAYSWVYLKNYRTWADDPSRAQADS